MFERAAKILASAGVEVTEKSSVTLLAATKMTTVAGVEMAQKFGSESTKIAAEAGLGVTKLTTQAALDATKLTTEAGVKASENAIIASERFGVDAAKVFAPIVGAAVLVYGASTVVDMGTRLYVYNNPDEDKKARDNQAREVNEYIDAKRAFRTCLKNNLNTQRNTSGIPTACENLANMFAIAAGSRSGLDEMTETFKSLYRE